MNKFLRNVLASFVAFILAGGLLIILFFGIIFGLAGSLESSFGKVEKVKIDKNSVYHLKLDHRVVDRAPQDPFENIDFGPFSGNKKIGLDDLLKSIRAAADEEKIKGIFIEFNSFPGGLANLEEVRNALVKFKESGKWVVTYGESYSQGALYLASVADESYLYPEGNAMWTGLSTQIAYLKGLLDKLDIEMQAVKGPDNKYKSAVEPLIYDQMTEANREQISKYLNSIWDHWLEGISVSRSIPFAMLDNYADSLMVIDGESAVKYGMIDGLRYRDEVIDELMKKMEVEDEDDLEMVTFAKMKNYRPGKKDAVRPKERIAVVYAVGEIRSGKSEQDVMGSETIAEAIKKARKDTNVKAIVFRVNSPGGSALASDVIWREVELAKKEKPFVVSMGNLAASGGYYISCGADKIYASETTITGSIGVFGLIPVMEKFFDNKLGVRFYGEKTNEHADAMDGIRKLDDYEYSVINDAVSKIYYDFVQKVADGRGMTTAEVDAIAKGRVWTGKDAKEIGLVDELGGLEDAIAYAAEKAGVEDYRIRRYPLEKDPFEEFIKELKGETSAYFIESVLGEDYRYYQMIKSAREMKGVQARMPFVIEFNY